MHKLCWTERIAVGMLMVGLAATIGFAAEKSQESPAVEGKGSGKEESAGTPATTLPADFVNYTESIPGTDLTYEMIAVPGGTFLMGSPVSETGRKEDEGPQHEVTVSPFWIAKTEVMWDQYDAFRNACPGLPKGTPEWEEPDLEDVDGISGPTPPYGDPYRGFGGGNKPAIGVSWHATMTHCLWLSKVTGKFYRLPTEAEWEYACRAGSKGTFCFGDDVSALGEYAWYKKNSEHQTRPVGTKKPNAWGVQDMHGNVSEWCLDWYQPDYYSSIPSGKWPPDPRGPEKGNNHVIRGGLMGSEADAPRVRSGSRDHSQDWWLQLDPMDPKSKWWHCGPATYVGFRVVRPLKPEKPPVRESRRGL